MCATSSAGCVRLRQEIVRTGLKPVTLSSSWDLAVNIRIGMSLVWRILLQAPRDFVAIHDRHHDVQQDHVRLFAQSAFARPCSPLAAALIW